MGPTRIVLIDEGPLIERLASLFERSENETAVAPSNGERVCEALILAPNLILLDLTRARADPCESGRPTRESTTAGDVPIFKLALAKQQLRNSIADIAGGQAEQEHAVSHLTSEHPLSSPEPTTDSTAPEQLDPVLQMGPVRIDRHGHWAYLNEKKLHLTPTEFRLLECFLREPGRAFTRSQLLDVSIGNASFVLERTIDVHIRSLRTKLGAARELIETVRGVGYRFRESQDSP